MIIVMPDPIRTQTGACAGACCWPSIAGADRPVLPGCTPAIAVHAPLTSESDITRDHPSSPERTTPRIVSGHCAGSCAVFGPHRITVTTYGQVRGILGDPEVKINWVWMPPWGPDKITDDGRDQLRMLGFNV
ncbi:hypothetical protein GCM10009642_43940 [Nocardiopsis metallicus]